MNHDRLARGFSRALIWTVLVLLASGILINLLEDPYGLYRLFPSPHGLNYHSNFNKERMVKAHEIRHRPYQTIILGSSRSLMGLRTTHPGWGGAPVYSLTFGATNIHEIWLYLFHAQSQTPLRRVVLGLDFFMFNLDRDANPAFAQGRLDQWNAHPLISPAWYDLPTLFSINTLTDSIRQIRWRARGIKSDYVQDGRFIDPSETVEVRQKFYEVIKEYATAIWLPKGHFYLDNQHCSILDNFRKIVALAHAKNIDLHLFISPSHAWLWEGLRVVGLWEQFETWKRGLVRINREVADRVDGVPFPLWDFSGFNDFTREDVPAFNEYRPMRWFFEASHYREALGDHLLDRLFNVHPSDRVGLDSFGVRLESHNLENHLQEIRKEESSYRSSHVRDWNEIQGIVQALDRPLVRRSSTGNAANLCP